MDEDECCECVAKFDQVAGIKDVKSAAPVVVTHASSCTLNLPTRRKTGTRQLASALLYFAVIVHSLTLILAFYTVKKCGNDKGAPQGVKQGSNNENRSRNS